MKKIFFFAFAMFAALAVNAQKSIFFTEPIEAGNLDGQSFGSNGFLLSCVDQANKMSVDANNCWFGDANDHVKFTHRFKTGGKSQVKDGQTNGLELAIPENGDLYIYVRNGSKNTAGRYLALSQDGDEIFKHEFLDSEAQKVKGLDSKDPEKETDVFPVFKVAVKSGKVSLDYAGGAMLIYGFSLGGPIVQGVETINAESSAKMVKRIVDGQVVIERDGRMFNLLGAEIK